MVAAFISPFPLRVKDDTSAKSGSVLGCLKGELDRKAPWACDCLCCFGLPLPSLPSTLLTESCQVRVPRISTLQFPEE